MLNLDKCALTLCISSRLCGEWKLKRTLQDVPEQSLVCIRNISKYASFLLIKVRVIGYIVRNCKGSTFICALKISTKHATKTQNKGEKKQFRFWAGALLKNSKGQKKKWPEPGPNGLGVSRRACRPLYQRWKSLKCVWNYLSSVFNKSPTPPLRLIVHTCIHTLTLHKALTHHLRTNMNAEDRYLHKHTQTRTHSHVSCWLLSRYKVIFLKLTKECGCLSLLTPYYFSSAPHTFIHLTACIAHLLYFCHLLIWFCDVRWPIWTNTHLRSSAEQLQHHKLLKIIWVIICLSHACP